MWICQSLSLAAMPAHPAALLGLPPCGLQEDSCHCKAISLLPSNPLSLKTAMPISPNWACVPVFPPDLLWVLPRDPALSLGNFSGARKVVDGQVLPTSGFSAYGLLWILPRAKRVFSPQFTACPLLSDQSTSVLMVFRGFIRDHGNPQSIASTLASHECSLSHFDGRYAQERPWEW